MSRNPCIGWQDGDTASKTFSDGTVLTGKVRIRKAHNSGRPYIKIAVLGRQQWEWPEGWVIGEGARAGECLECGQAFRTNAKHPSGFCPPCDREFESRTRQPRAIRNLAGFMLDARGRKAVSPHTDEELAEIAAQQAKDSSESPFG